MSCALRMIRRDIWIWGMGRTECAGIGRQWRIGRKAIRRATGIYLGWNLPEGFRGIVLSSVLMEANRGELRQDEDGV